MAQGEEAKEDILYQDDKSCIILHKNYLFSTSKGSKYINIYYFFAVDRIEKEKMRIVYYLIEDMIADRSSKPV